MLDYESVYYQEGEYSMGQYTLGGESWIKVAEELTKTEILSHHMLTAILSHYTLTVRLSHHTLTVSLLLVRRTLFCLTVPGDCLAH